MGGGLHLVWDQDNFLVSDLVGDDGTGHCEKKRQTWR